MKTNFKDKVVIITGAAGGIGRALASRFGMAGAKLILLDLDAESLHSLEYQLRSRGVDVLTIECDITDESACSHSIQKAINAYGGADVLINNAGISHRSPFAKTQTSVFRRVMEVNYFGALHCTRAALASLIERKGSIITLSSHAGFTPQFERSGYSASKFALHGLFESLRMELRPEGVHVMMVCPGFTATDINKNALLGDGTIAEKPFAFVGYVASPTKVADRIFKAACNKKRMLILSNVGIVSRTLATLFPKFHQRFISRKMGIQAEG